MSTENVILKKLVIEIPFGASFREATHTAISIVKNTMVEEVSFVFNGTKVSVHKDDSPDEVEMQFDAGRRTPKVKIETPKGLCVMAGLVDSLRKRSNMLSDEEVNAITSMKYKDLTDEQKVIYGMGYRHAKETYCKQYEDEINRLRKECASLSSDLGWTRESVRDMAEDARIRSGGWQ